MQRVPSLFRRLKFAPLGAAELFGVQPTDADFDVASVGMWAQESWQLWRQKHAALTASERLYASLLSDSRRTAALSAEVKALETLLAKQDINREDCPASDEQVDGPAAPSSSSPSRRRQREAAAEVLSECCAVIEAHAADAKAALRERVRHYPCGRVCEVTGYLRIARAQEDVEEVLSAFEDRIALETQEAMTQALELAVAPDPAALTDVLARRLAFWEAEIEESWAHWSAQASAFHEACRGASEAWQKLQASAQALLEKLGVALKGPAEETPPIVYLVPFLDMRAIQQHRQWDDAHDSLVKAAAAIALLGAWTEYHHLRGDGEALLQARGLLSSLLRALDTHFDPSRYDGSDAVKASLASDETWRLVGPLAERVWFAEQEATCTAAEEEGACGLADAAPWWSPRAWPSRRVGPATPSVLRAEAAEGSLTTLDSGPQRAAPDGYGPGPPES